MKEKEADQQQREASGINALDVKAQAVRIIYFDAQSRRANSVASFKRLVGAGRAIGLADDEAKVAILSIFDYARPILLDKLLAKGVITQDQIERSKF